MYLIPLINISVSGIPGAPKDITPWSPNSLWDLTQICFRYFAPRVSWIPPWLGRDFTPFYICSRDLISVNEKLPPVPKSPLFVLGSPVKCRLFNTRLSCLISAFRYSLGEHMHEAILYPWLIQCDLVTVIWDMHRDFMAFLFYHSTYWNVYLLTNKLFYW